MHLLDLTWTRSETPISENLLPWACLVVMYRENNIYHLRHCGMVADVFLFTIESEQVFGGLRYARTIPTPLSPYCDTLSPVVI